MLPSPNELIYFLEIASSGNISRAAERLGVTQPTLSLAIQRLESSLGVTLLLRSKTGVRLTKAGARFTPRAQSLLEQWDKIRGETLADETEVQGRIAIGCHPSVALYALPRFLPALLKTYTKLEVPLVHDLSRKITERVISFEIDMGLVVNPVAHPDLVLIPLATDEVTYWKGPRVGNEDILICDPDLIQSQNLQQKEKKFGLEFRRRMASSSLEVIAQLVSNGAGIGILPSLVATRDASLKLKPLLSKGPVFHDRICLAYRNDLQKAKTSKVVIQAIKEAFRVSGV